MDGKVIEHAQGRHVVVHLVVEPIPGQLQCDGKDLQEDSGELFHFSIVGVQCVGKRGWTGRKATWGHAGLGIGRTNGEGFFEIGWYLL